MRNPIDRLVSFQGGFNELIPQLKRGIRVVVNNQTLKEIGFDLTEDNPTKGIMVGELWIERIKKQAGYSDFSLSSVSLPHPLPKGVII